MNINDVNEAQCLVDEIAKILAGKLGHIQSAALADCVAIWLSGHFVENSKGKNARATFALREDLFKKFCELVKELMPLYERISNNDAQNA